MEQIKQILKNKKIYLRDFIAIIVIFFLSLFVEQVLLQWNSFKNEKYEQTFQVSEVQKAENKDGETTYDFLFDGRYVSSIYLIYQSKTDISSRMEVTFYDGYGQKEVMELEDQEPSEEPAPLPDVDETVEEPVMAGGFPVYGIYLDVSPWCPIFCYLPVP